MNNFTDLDHLIIIHTGGSTRADISWPVSTISSTVMFSFMKFIQKCNRCYIDFGGASEENWLMNQFYKSIGEGNHGTYFILANDRALQQEDFRVVLVRDNKNKALFLKYCMEHQRISKLNEVFNGLHESTVSVTLHCDGVTLPVAEYFDRLLGSTLHAKLKLIMIMSGNLREFITAQDLQPRAPNTRHLNFKTTSIDEAALPRFSTAFPTLDSLGFDNCSFVRTSGHINVSMPNTAINTLKVDMGNINEKAILFSLCLVENSISKYYFDVAQEDPILEITRAKFCHLQELLIVEIVLLLLLLLNPSRMLPLLRPSRANFARSKLTSLD